MQLAGSNFIIPNYKNIFQIRVDRSRQSKSAAAMAQDTKLDDSQEVAFSFQPKIVSQFNRRTRQLKQRSWKRIFYTL